MTTTAERAAAAAARRAAYHEGGLATSERAAAAPGALTLRSVPVGVTRSVPFRSELRAKLVERDGKEFHEVSGYASVFGQEFRYEMWDFFGPYDEWVAEGAADETLAAQPDVVFLVNHKGLAMARTTAGTLELSADGHGLHERAWLNPQRQDVRDLILGIDDKVITEQSFAFRITEGWWNDDFTEFQIKAFDIDRGDVSAVNYGANPHTDIASRQRDLLGELDLMPAWAARGALSRLGARTDLIDLLGSQLLARREDDRTGRTSADLDAVQRLQDAEKAAARAEPPAKSKTPLVDMYSAMLEADA